MTFRGGVEKYWGELKEEVDDFNRKINSMGPIPQRLEEKRKNAGMGAAAIKTRH
jgi:hypothetical protein